ncbi:MAG: hypothetical protein IKJ19_00025 [Clostridia bacterium]|nr:hypothetical protein [Clostridia bacterium]
MKESRVVCYKLIKVGNCNAFVQSLIKVNGVIKVNVDDDLKILTYEIDEWASDYDVFTEVMRIADECGMEIDFDGAGAEEKDDSFENAESESGEKTENNQSSLNLQTEVEEEPSSQPKKKGGLSERWQRVIELSAALICYVIALFLNDIPQYIFLAMAFAVAGYDALYETFIKLTKKIIFSEELLISLAFFCSIFLGYAKYAVIAVLLYSIVAFVKKFVKEEIEKSPVFANYDQTVTLLNEDGVKKVKIQQLTTQAHVLLDSGCVAPFDCTACSSSSVRTYKGKVREVNDGDLIYAGERIESELEVVVVALGDDCKYAKYNEFLKNAANTTSPIAKAFKKSEQIINASVFGVCLIIAFVFPLFSKQYSYLAMLPVWAYRAIIIASISGLSFYTFASEMNLLSALTRSRKCRLAFLNYEAIVKVANSNKIFVDYEGALLDEKGNLKEDAVGAIRELKDFKLKDISLACTAEESVADAVCKKLKIKECYLRNSKEEKLAEIKNALGGGAICVTDTNEANALSGERGAVVCLNCESGGYNGDVCISSDEIAYVPYAIKLAKRTAKIQKSNLVLGIIVKVALIVLACFGVAELWWAVLVDSLVSLVCSICAFINSKEVY